MKPWRYNESRGASSHGKVGGKVRTVSRFSKECLEMADRR